MKVICNGKEKEIGACTHLATYVRQLGLEENTIVVECDGRILRREEWETHELREGSRLELIRFVGGG